MDTLAQSVGNSIAARRRLLDLTQQEVADRAGVSQKYISALERGERIPNLDTLDQIAGALGVPIRDLLPEAVVTEDAA